MDIQRFSPWNWFKHEESQPTKSLPVTRQRYVDPFSQLHQEIDRLFDSHFAGLGLRPAEFSNSLQTHSLLRPSIDISESDKEYHVKVEVPGVDEDDVKLELSEGVLTISGEKKSQKEDKDKNFYRRESAYGSFRRVLSLPEDINEDAIKAEFKKGILTVTIPRKALSKAEIKHINIKKAA